MKKPTKGQFSKECGAVFKDLELAKAILGVVI